MSLEVYIAKEMLCAIEYGGKSMLLAWKRLFAL